MRKSKKKYAKPLVQVTIYECADVITRSELFKTPGGKELSPGKSYVSAGSKSWKDGLTN